MRRLLAALSAIHQGVWLGLLDRPAIHLLALKQYGEWPEYRDRGYNLGGLETWERDLVERHFAGRDRVVVAAAGGGREALALARAGHRVTAFECQPELVASAARLFEAEAVEVELAAAPPDRVPPLAGRFDAALVGWGSLMHIAGRGQRIRFLAELSSALTPGSPVAVSFLERRGDERSLRWIARVANLLRALRRAPERAEVGDTLDRTFDHRFTESELTSELEAAGLAVLEYRSKPYPHAVAAKRSADG